MTFHIHKIPEVESGRSLFLLLDPLQQHNPPPPSPPSSLSLLGLDWNNCLFFAEEKEALHEVSSKQQPSSIAGRRHRHSSTLPACLPSMPIPPSLDPHGRMQQLSKPVRAPKGVSALAQAGSLFGCCFSYGKSSRSGLRLAGPLDASHFKSIS